MVTIITGPLNSGKTTRVVEEYRNVARGDGFVSLKRMNGKVVEGFDLMRLSTGEKRPFIRRIGSEPKNWVENCTLGPYTFSDDAVGWAAMQISGFISNGISPVYLDEVGIMELAGKCFYKIVKKIVNSGTNAYISVRDESLEAVIEKLEIDGAKIIKMGDRYA